MHRAQRLPLPTARSHFLHVPNPPPHQLNVTALATKLNTTKRAIVDQVALKLKPPVSVDPAALRFTGTVTCFVDDATGDVAGLQLGTAPPLCSTAGTRRSFAVPSDSYVSDLKVAVDKDTGLVGEFVFTVKSNNTLKPTTVFSCGKKGGLPVSVVPKMSALASVSGGCKAPGLSIDPAALTIDPAALSVGVTTVNAPTCSSVPSGRLAAAAVGDGIYTGAVGASSWTKANALPLTWTSVASSSDGCSIAAVFANGGIYRSWNGGLSWAQVTNGLPASVDWRSIASSSDGSRLAAVFASGGIYTSADGGWTWTQTSAPALDWYTIASSSDGSKLAAGVGGNSGTGPIYTSADGGLTWTLTSAPNNLDWKSIASSSDGSKLAAVNYGGGIYTSANGGSTWILTSAPNNLNWKSIASSSDGSKLAAGVDGGGIYTSANGGSTWILTSAPSATWYSIASSA